MAISAGVDETVVWQHTALTFWISVCWAAVALVCAVCVLVGEARVFYVVLLLASVLVLVRTVRSSIVVTNDQLVFRSAWRTRTVPLNEVVEARVADANPLTRFFGVLEVETAAGILRSDSLGSWKPGAALASLEVAKVASQINSRRRP
jgi:hypothetical protein